MANPSSRDEENPAGMSRSAPHLGTLHGAFNNGQENVFSIPQAMSPTALSQAGSLPTQHANEATPLTNRTGGDYFTNAAHPVPNAAATQRIPRNQDWSLFVQLLEDDRVPGARQTPRGASSTWSAATARRLSSAAFPPASISDNALHGTPSIGSTRIPSKPSSLRHVVRDTSRQRGLLSNIPSEASIAGNVQHGDGAASPYTVEPTHVKTPTFFQRVKRRMPSFTMTQMQKNVLKCAIAYFIGSLFTYNEYLASFLSDLVPLGEGGLPSPSGHMVATVVAYYNPAKTIGGMFEADAYCTLGALYSSVVCLLSFGLFWFFKDLLGTEIPGGIAVFICLAVAMGLVSWSKLWMERPTFNTACSMTCIIIFIVMVREGGADLLGHVVWIVFLGSIITNTICFLLWPQSATTNLQNNMSKVLASFATLLDMTIETFLLQENYHPNHQSLLRAVEEHQGSFTSLKKNLPEAKSEWCDYRMRAASRRLEGSEYELYDAAVEGLTRLAQHLNGLRDGTRLQFEMAAQGINAARNGTMSQTQEDNLSDAVLPEERDHLSRSPQKEGYTESSRRVFKGLVDDVEKPLDGLGDACIETLNRMRSFFGDTPGSDGWKSNEEFMDLYSKIEIALQTFEEASDEALMRSYQSADHDGAPAMEENEGVFLVYFFMFTLQEFARELAILTEIVGAIKEAEQDYISDRWNRPFRWLLSFLPCSFAPSRSRKPQRDVEARRRQTTLRTQPSRPRVRRQISVLLPRGNTPKPPPIPKIRPHAPNTVQTPGREMLTFTGRLKRTIWDIAEWLRESEIRYSIKCGLAIATLASPALFDATKPYFERFRGEWALISCFVVLSPTIGQTNNLSMHRIGSTILGAGTAALIWTLFPYNPYVLSVFGAFFSMPCFYYIISKPQYATSGRFVLLAYNLTALFCYNVRHNTDINPISIAIRRVISVSAGVLWALFISRVLWPTEARRALADGLGDFCLSVGWLYTKLVEQYSVPPEALAQIASPSANNGQVRQRAMTHIAQSIHDFMAMELHLQIRLIQLQGLLAQTQHEPRLKGPFPIHLYRAVLTSLQVILDKLHTMRCVTTREEWYTTVRRDFIIPVNRERREMVGNIILYFSTLAAAFALKRALPPYLPPAEEARRRLVSAIRELEIVKRKEVKQAHHLLYFAYALMMKGVIQELDYLGETLQDAFGVIGQSVEHFEELFHNDLHEY